MVEREAFAVAQLVAAMEAGHLDPAPVWSDARTFDGKPWRGIVDGFIGGIPCQPHSLAGRKRGQHDPRDLWTDARRIIVQSRPWFVLIENVEGMLSAGADEVAGAERVWRDLRKLGFAVEGGLFTASEVGASHQRGRIFILGVADPIGQRGRSGDARGEDAADAHSTGQGVADAGVGSPERWRGAGDLAGASGHAQGEASERERRGRASGDRREGMEHASRLGRGEGRAEPILRSGRDATAGSDGAMGDAIGGRHDWRQDDAQRRPIGRAAVERAGEHLGLFPPGPGDLSSWRTALERAPELEPAFRRVADGLASRLDIARVDRLRLLGNGVVPLEAAYAIRTLAKRLADRGHDRLWKYFQHP